MPFDLTEAVRRKLNITWHDDDTDGRISDIIATVKPALARTIGIYETDPALTSAGEVAGLLINACFYEWNHALDEFWVNYADDIQRLRIMNESDFWELAND